MFTLDQLNTAFIRKSEACKKLGLTPWQLNLLIVTAKLPTPKLAGASHLYAEDVTKLTNSPLVEAVRTKSTQFENISATGVQV
jgi:hypothetical protein